MNQVLQDLRFALRILTKSPGFTSVALIVLALGIGANTAIFSMVDAVLLRPLPYRDPTRLVAIWQTAKTSDPKLWISYRDLEEWRKQSGLMESLAGYRWWQFTLTGPAEAEKLFGELVTVDFFRVLGVPAAQGRTFTRDDVSGPPVVVLSHALWKSRFGGENVLGKVMVLDSQPHTVIGVMPPSFDFYPRVAQFWTLIIPQHDYLGINAPHLRTLAVAGRLKPGAGMAAAANELLSIRRGLEQKDPDDFTSVGVVMADLQREIQWLSGNIRPALLILFAAVGVVLLITCTNVANLVLGRTLERRKEIAVRAAVGCGRWRLIRQLLTESVLLALAGAALGVVVALVALRYLNSSTPIQLPPGNVIGVDLRVLGFTVLAAVLCGTLFGLAPAIQTSRLEFNQMLKDGQRGSSSGLHGHRMRGVLVIAEVGLSLVLMVAAALLIESFLRMRAEPLGYNAENLTSMHLDLLAPAYPTQARRDGFINGLMERLSLIAGVRAAVTGELGIDSLFVEGRPQPAIADNVFAHQRAVTPGYFEVMGIPLVRGRELRNLDRANAEPVAVVNQETVRRLFPDTDPVGHRIAIGPPDQRPPWLKIVGVAADTKQVTQYNEMQWRSEAQIFVPLEQQKHTGNAYLTILVRSDPKLQPDSRRTIADVRAAVMALDRNLPVYRVRTMNEDIYRSTAQPRFRAVLLGAFAGLALLLAAVGVYGVLAQMVWQSRQEIGIRMAVGATAANVIWMIVWRGVALALIGVIFGVVAALSLTPILRAFLFGVGPSNPLTFVSVSVLMLLVAMLASLIPALRATRVDPVDVLRAQ